MDFPGLQGYMTGVAVPVTALRGDNDVGVGEFADLPRFGRFCRDSGLQVLQILPINDSGFDSSPYSALSAYALHPIYLRIADLPELAISAIAESVAPALQTMHENALTRTRVAYHEVLDAKFSVLRTIYDTVADAIASDAAVQTWISRNAWVKPYAVFRMHKDRNGQAAWWEWAGLQDPTPADIEAFWSDGESARDLLFYAWIQMRLEQQLSQAVERLEAMGVYLKGDIPILMNDDSADVWLHRSAFRRDLRAGAPPDMFSHDGQNWGFPLYDWDVMKQTGYSWWKDRLYQADKFFHLFRIDHVLGFFRIWAVPATNESGMLGYFRPSRYLTLGELQSIGMDEGRIQWLSEPHVQGELLRAVFDTYDDPDLLHRCFARIGDEDLYLFAPGIRGERDILALPMSETHREQLVSIYKDRALLKLGNDRYVPTWTFRECSRYQLLGESEKRSFEDLVSQADDDSQRVWEEQGRELLGFMCSTVDMLACAEDLGVVPPCVPRVLDDLGILGLRVPRWTRVWDAPGEPFIPPKDFSYSTVCAASVHDTSSTRGWWYEDPSIRDPFWAALDLPGKAPAHFTTDAARQILTALAGTGSALCMFQMQDLMSMCEDLVPESPGDERINIPGTYNTGNWSYRLPRTTGELESHPELIDLIREIVDARRQHSL